MFIIKQVGEVVKGLLATTFGESIFELAKSAILDRILIEEVRHVS